MTPGEQQEPNQSLSLFKAFISAIFLAIVCALLSASLPLSFAQGDLQVTFIDVGQGDAAWLRTPDGLDILIDGGETGQGPDLVLYLHGQGVTDIHVLILSHPDEDHVGGLVAVLENEEIDVHQALMNCEPREDLPAYQDFQDLLVNKGIPTTCVRDGHTFAWGSYVSAVVVNPPEPLMTGTDHINNNSVVLRISYDTIDFLFTGDIESEAEGEILDRDRTVEAEILKVPHHGSRYSSTAPFLTAVGPEMAVISVGPNPHGHPHVEALQRLQDAGATVCRTDEDGTIVATTDGTTYSVQCGVSYSYTYLPLVLKAWPATPTPSIEVSAWVSDPTPARYTTVTVYGQFLVNGAGVAGVPMHTTWHYKTVTRYCDGVTDATGLARCSRDIGGATIGYTVIIDVEFTYGGQVYHTSTSFTPW